MYYKGLMERDIQNFITSMSIYCKADMESAEKSYEISWAWDRMTCIHIFQRRFGTTEEFNQKLDNGFLEALHKACERVGISVEHESKMIDASGWNWNWKEGIKQFV